MAASAAGRFIEPIARCLAATALPAERDAIESQLQRAAATSPTPVNRGT